MVFWKKTRSKESEAEPELRVGEYRCLELLGRGGMGSVYRAVDAQGRTWALKQPEVALMSDPGFRARFAREGELGATLSHPHIIRVHACSTEPPPHMVLELIQGTSLDQVPPAGWPKDWRRSRRWAEQLLDALVYLHAREVIHRDLKPGNLMVRTDGNLVLMDFGLVHKAAGTRLTGTHDVLGTPYYMAPEQVSGSAVTPAIDLYAVGMILYERLAGFMPFPEQLADILRAKLQHDLTPLHEVDFDIPPPVSDYVARLTDPDPRARFPNAERALLALRRLPLSF